MDVFLVVFVGVIITLLILAVVGVIGGIIGIVYSKKLKANNNPKSKKVAVTSLICLLVCLAILLNVAPITAINIFSQPDEKFYVETDIVIKESGYQEKKFTANGIVYEAIDFEINNFDAVKEPVFTYKANYILWTEGGNYFKVENAQGFDIVSDEFGNVFCPKKDKDKVLKFYSDISKMSGFIGYYDDNYDYKEIKIDIDKNECVKKLIKLDNSKLKNINIFANSDKEFYIYLYCNEKIFKLKEYWLIQKDGKVYYLDEEETASTFSENNYVAYQIPEDISTELFALYSNSMKNIDKEK